MGPGKREKTHRGKVELQSVRKLDPRLAKKIFANSCGSFKMGCCIALVESHCDTATVALVFSSIVRLDISKDWRRPLHGCRTERLVAISCGVFRCFFGGRSDPKKRLPSEKFGGFQTNPLFLKKNPGRNSKYRFSEVFGRQFPVLVCFQIFHGSRRWKLLSPSLLNWRRWIKCVFIPRAYGTAASFENGRSKPSTLERWFWMFFLLWGELSKDSNAIDDNNDDLITMIIVIMIMIILIKAVLDKHILKCIDR